MVNAAHTINWTAGDKHFSARWRAENGSPAPKRVIIADDTITANAAYRLACEGTAMLWRGDFQNAKQLLQALARRSDAKSKRATRKQNSTVDQQAEQLPADAFNLHRQAQSQRARTLAMLLIPFDADYTIPLKRAPDARLACAQAWGQGGSEEGGSEGAAAGDSASTGSVSSMSTISSLRELLGMIGAYEWRRKGVDVPALNEKIYPHYGVFAPIRGEYVRLVAEASLPNPMLLNTPPVLAFDIGTGTGVLAAVLSQRGIKKIIATDQDARALACARENITRLKLNDRVEIIEADLFPVGRAPLIVCNPPWLPARPASPIERAIYDPESVMLRGFLNGLAAHLERDGEGWLILSDLAEHLGLRTREALLGWIDVAGLIVAGKNDVRPIHPRVADVEDVLHAARVKEVTSLWRLRAR